MDLANKNIELEIGDDPKLKLSEKLAKDKKKGSEVRRNEDWN